MGRKRSWLAVIAAIALVSGLAAPEAAAVKLDETAIFIEINATDGDAGIQLFLDGEGWDTMQLTAPDGTVLLNVAAEGSIGIQGITELFFESAEPSFDEQPLEELLELFPEGIYRFRGTTTEGEVLRGRARLNHALPEGPVIVLPVEESVVPVDEVVVEWLGVPDPPGGRIVGYEVVVEKDEGKLQVFKADMPAVARRIAVPEEFLRRGTAYKAEVLAVEKFGNQTITEVEFETENGDDEEDEDDED